MKKLLFIALLLFSLSPVEAQNDIRYKMVVALDGSGDFTSIQAAIDATKSLSAGTHYYFYKKRYLP